MISKVLSLETKYGDHSRAERGKIPIAHLRFLILRRIIRSSVHVVRSSKTLMQPLHN